jgi:hypothetical protein
MSGTGRHPSSLAAHVVLLAVVGFLIAVTFGFGPADRHSSGGHGRLHIEVSEPSPILTRRDDNAPIAGATLVSKLPPTAATGCRP